ncbi:hypothetical protein EMPS_04862 [Entomortierella parvispora]|uniref:Uncharacterized protein n=1 Tax=Entomortierella parvispora TaxID=205924 RepID=A0A9P3LVZ0_9FUNG|nr:hypothetical protein EMPS_04862 [Entomortierella parvispora]
MIFNFYKTLLAAFVVAALVSLVQAKCIAANQSCKNTKHKCCPGTKCINRYKDGLICMRQPPNAGSA